ncbi:unnamed protein product [Caenorhabditis auriculariae]|uniref:Protein Wnt n=1 Tax=Caenorhabditis auriculariae TaxID=2777116 RepID=A0A8S1H9B2_9PELO|nr:unnamed protein product [Caenorhabditis auriculariae]
MATTLKATIFIFLLLLPFCYPISWLALGLTNSRLDRGRPAVTCRNLTGLTRKQTRFCKRNFELMDSVQNAAFNAAAECQFQFNKRRWNCSIIDPVSLKVVGDVVLRQGTRESAFVHAISSAAVAYRVTRDCARGMNDRCGCDYSKNDTSAQHRSQYQYQGCSDNVKYGIAISREFVDAAEQKQRLANGTTITHPDSVINLHNNRAGRQVLEKALRRECKCHGMSGSCEMKTCWDSLPTFREIGLQIKDKFDGASEVRVVDEEKKGQIVMKNSQFKRHTNADLVYMAPSPDFCEADPSRGILGTRGRQCSLSQNAIDDCQILCCGRGFEKKVELVDDMCNCKFHYCCRVDCTPCKKRTETYFCL